MATFVYANGNEIASKASDGKAVAAFPDVCFSPPSPPVGPIPLPYPNTGEVKDTDKGTAKVFIKDKMSGMEKSSYMTKSMGDEGATQSQGKGIITSALQGKCYFAVWAMDVKMEGKGVPRHLDMVTHNHASPNAQTTSPSQITPDQKPAVTGEKPDINSYKLHFDAEKVPCGKKVTIIILARKELTPDDKVRVKHVRPNDEKQDEATYTEYAVSDFSKSECEENEKTTFGYTVKYSKEFTMPGGSTRTTHVLESGITSATNRAAVNKADKEFAQCSRAPFVKKEELTHIKGFVSDTDQDMGSYDFYIKQDKETEEVQVVLIVDMFFIPGLYDADESKDFAPIEELASSDYVCYKSELNKLKKLPKKLPFCVENVVKKKYNFSDFGERVTSALNVTQLLGGNFSSVKKTLKGVIETKNNLHGIITIGGISVYIGMGKEHYFEQKGKLERALNSVKKRYDAWFKAKSKNCAEQDVSCCACAIDVKFYFCVNFAAILQTSEKIKSSAPHTADHEVFVERVYSSDTPASIKNACESIVTENGMVVCDYCKRASQHGIGIEEFFDDTTAAAAAAAEAKPAAEASKSFFERPFAPQSERLERTCCHEFGHYFGWIDEYTQGSIEKNSKDSTKKSTDWKTNAESLMGNSTYVSCRVPAKDQTVKGTYDRTTLSPAHGSRSTISNEIEMKDGHFFNPCFDIAAYYADTFTEALQKINDELEVVLAK